MRTLQHPARRKDVHTRCCRGWRLTAWLVLSRCAAFSLKGKIRRPFSLFASDLAILTFLLFTCAAWRAPAQILCVQAYGSAAAMPGMASLGES